MLSHAEVLVRLRDLCVYLHRRNTARTDATLAEVVDHLKETLANAESPDAERAQQTSFAIDEVRTLLAQDDSEGAEAAARDAVREWTL
jgi:hypothetical protein